MNELVFMRTIEMLVIFVCFIKFKWETCDIVKKVNEDII